MLFDAVCYRWPILVIQADIFPPEGAGNQKFIPEVSKGFDVGIEV